MLFSIVVPIYNVESYILNCLNSIKMQSYTNFEVILVNDGSTDASFSIASDFIKDDKRFSLYNKENGGLSSARNYGIEKAKGDFLIFVDSDDSLNIDLLKELNKEIGKNNPELIKYRVNKIEDEQNDVYKTKLFNNIDGKKALLNLIDDPLFVTSWSTAYNMAFFKKNKFAFAINRVHEDFGLTPLIYMQASNVSSIEYVGYNYYIRSNSIMTNQDIAKQKKKNEDFLFHYDNLIFSLESISDLDFKRIFKSYLANALITRASDLKDDILSSYLKELKRRKIYNDLIDDTLVRKIKKILIKISPKTYIKIFKK